MSVPPISAVVFDCFGVLTSSPFAGIGRYEADRGYPDGALRTLLLGDYTASAGDDDWHRMERGELSAAEFWQGFVARAASAGMPVDLGDFLRSFAGGVSVRDDVLAAAALLRPAYRTAVLSNNVREYAETWRAMVRADATFDVVLDSSELGMRKPDPEIFLHTCATLGVDPAAAVFCDDVAGNVAGAVAVGMVGIVVDDAAQLLADLGDLLASRGSAGVPDGWPRA